MIRLFMAGDVLIHERLYEDAETENGSYDFKPMIEMIKPLVLGHDLAFYNQETLLGGVELGLSGYPRFNSPSEVGDAFIDAGFNMVALANNHTMDKDEAGVVSSVNYWKKHGDKVIYTGQWISAEEREEETSRIYEKNGIRFAFFAYTTWTNELETPEGKEYLNNVYSDEKAAADIAKVRDKCDLIIVAMHWGTEYYSGIDDDQARIGKFLSDQGVQLIIGSHTHVVGPVKYINDGKSLVIYSLGNFLSDQNSVSSNSVKIGLMVRVVIRKSFDEDGNVSIIIESPQTELSYVFSNETEKKNYKIYPFSKLTDEILPGYESVNEEYQGIVSSS
jgi:poly-gamma-glutamate synthesis protein (capsule biosynthesis protein)